jgi:toxin FitB
MKYLLDTCVVSEFTKKEPDKRVIAFLDAINPDDVCMSVITIGEIQHGIAALGNTGRRELLNTWLHTELIERFGQNILPVDLEAMYIWGDITGRLRKQGTPMPVIDSLLAAVCLSQKLVMVTRNVKDFSVSGCSCVNPWGES